ncbi:MAG: type II secretion system F family protein [archaeon]
MSNWLKIEGLVPRDLSQIIQKKVGYGGEKINARKVVGFLFGFPLFVAIAVTLNIAAFITLDTSTLVLTFVITTLMMLGSIFLLIDYYAMTRANRVNTSLPDALELISTNISAGLTIENALIESSRPEFGELGILLKRAAKEMFSGLSFDRALKNMSANIESDLLQKTVWLITEGIKKGGELGTLLLRIAKDLRDEEALKKEINANISMYILLIMIASIFGAPLLFGAGTTVAGMITKQTNVSITTPSMSGSGVPFSGIMMRAVKVNTITVESIKLFAAVSIMITSFFASLLIGIIRYNRELAGIRYFPIILIVSMAIYYITVFLFQMVLGNNVIQII